MRKVSYRNLALLFDASKKGALVVDLESENAMLVGKLKSGGEGGAVGGVRSGRQGKSLKRGEHAEFELEGIGRRHFKGPPSVVRVL